MRVIFLIAGFLISYNNASAQQKYVKYCNQELLETSKYILLNQVGIIEKTGKNDGEVEKYNNTIGIYKNAPYCATGQYYCFLVGTIILGMDESEIPILKTALANGIYNDAKINGIKSNYTVQNNDLLVWRYPNSWNGHIERVIAVGKAGWCRTVGFNTLNEMKTKEGVFIKNRNIYHSLNRMKIRGIVGFIDK